jgi:hypothetical protein
MTLSVVTGANRGIGLSLARALDSLRVEVVAGVDVAIEGGAKLGAAGLLASIDELTMETSGGFWHQIRRRLPW